MIEITKQEARIVRSKFPKACIAKTKNKRYLEESVRYLELIPGNPSADRILRREAYYKNKRAEKAAASNKH